MVNFMIWLILGAFIGWMTTLVIQRRRPILPLNIVLGSVCAIVVGNLLLPLLHISKIHFSLAGLLVLMGVTIVLLAVVNLFFKHTVANAVVEDKWSLIQRHIHARWGKITEEDVDQINGNYDRFILLIEERYGVAKEKAEDQLQKFLLAVI